MSLFSIEGLIYLLVGVIVGYYLGNKAFRDQVNTRANDLRKYLGKKMASDSNGKKKKAATKKKSVKTKE